MRWIRIVRDEEGLGCAILLYEQKEDFVRRGLTTAVQCFAVKQECICPAAEYLVALLWEEAL